MENELKKTDVSTTKVLLYAGVIAGPLFIGMSLILGLSREGFDLTRHPISLLLLGNPGWIQCINFELTGLLAALYAIGIWQLLHPRTGGTWGPVLVGLYGLGLILAGLFPPDPQFRFPPGSPDGIAAVMSAHANLHALGFFVSVLSLIIASFIFARRFTTLQAHGWAAYCIGTGVAAPAFLILGIVLTARASAGLPLFGVGVVTSAWISVIAMRLLKELHLGTAGLKT